MVSDENDSLGKVKSDFYVTPDGEVIPATGYRYVSEEAPYLDSMRSSMTIPENPGGTYICLWHN